MVHLLLSAPGLDRLSGYIAALAAHPAVKATQQPPGASGSYQEQLVENYKGYVAARRAAAAAT
jgi:hypothetical protein